MFVCDLVLQSWLLRCFTPTNKTTDSAVARERRGARGTSFSKRRASKQARERESKSERERCV